MHNMNAGMQQAGRESVYAPRSTFYCLTHEIVYRLCLSECKREGYIMKHKSGKQIDWKMSHKLRSPLSLPYFAKRRILGSEQMDDYEIFEEYE